MATVDQKRDGVLTVTEVAKVGGCTKKPKIWIPITAIALVALVGITLLGLYLGGHWPALKDFFMKDLFIGKLEVKVWQLFVVSGLAVAFAIGIAYGVHRCTKTDSPIERFDDNAYNQITVGDEGSCDSTLSLEDSAQPASQSIPGLQPVSAPGGPAQVDEVTQGVEDESGFNPAVFWENSNQPSSQSIPGLQPVSAPDGPAQKDFTRKKRS